MPMADAADIPVIPCKLRDHQNLPSIQDSSVVKIWKSNVISSD